MMFGAAYDFGMTSRTLPPDGNTATLAVRVRPNARKTQVLGYREGTLTVAVAAPAVEGKANEALLVYLAAVLAVRRSQVTIRRGMRSRDKLVMVEGLSPREVTERLTAVTGPHQPRLMDDVRGERSKP